MFGSRNGRQIEPRRIPSKRNIAKQANTCCGDCCTSLANCCVSCGAHGWFLTLFCGYVLVSSLPRILIILDFIITLSLYFDINGYHGFKSTETWLRNSFSFKQSTFDVVILSFVRCIILFICFAYRYQREGYRKNIYVSSITVLLTSAYLIVKLLYNETSIVIFSLSFVWIECIFFFMVRRRRIRYSPSFSRIGSYYSLSQRERKIMKPGKSKYYRIDDEETNHSQSPHASLVNNNVNLHYNSSSDDIKPNANPHPIAIAQATPPPFINDTFMDDYIGEKNQKHTQSKLKVDGEQDEEKKYAHDTDEEEDEEDEDVDKSNKTLLGKMRKKKKKKKQKERERKKSKRKFMGTERKNVSAIMNYSIEHSQSALSATVPDSEFSAHELPLKTENSEFFIIDGVAIHYSLERNFNETVINDESIPWIVLLHGFGGGVFSWKRTMPMLLNELGDHIRGILAFDRVGFGLTERPLIANDEDNEDELTQQPEQKAQDTESESMNPYSIEFHLKILQTFLDKFSMTKCILIGHSTGCLVANWFAYHYPSYCDALILISAATEMPSFIRSILKTKLGKPIILSLVRSEIGQVTLHQAWHNPSCIPTSVIHSYKQVLKLKNWNESLLEMARAKPYSNSAKYHKALSKLTCPVWLLHGDDDKLVTFRESVALSQHFQHAFGPIKLRNCGHIPHEEIPKKFVQVIYQIVSQQLLQYKQHKSSYQLNLDGHENDVEPEDGNIINKGAKKFKDMMRNIHIIHRKGSSDASKLTDAHDDAKENINVNAKLSVAESDPRSASMMKGGGGDSRNDINMITEDNMMSSLVTENSALLSD